MLTGPPVIHRTDRHAGIVTKAAQRRSLRHFQRRTGAIISA